MITRSGLIELESGWIVGIAAVAPDMVRVVLQYDPNRASPMAGVKDIRVTSDEAFELIEALCEAHDRALPAGRTR